jgi:protein-tyrosine phosphatase
MMFICKGNICRSPFAEHMARKLSKEKDLSDFDLKSSGIIVGQSGSSPVEAVAAAKMIGIDLSDHISKSLNTQSAHDNDLIVTMEASHIKTLRKLHPDIRNKLFLLPLFERNGSYGKGYQKYNIPDPYGKNKETFQECYQRITIATEQMLCTICLNNHGGD